MNCNELKPLWMDYVYDEISEEDRSLLSAHLAECPSCRQELEALQQTSLLLECWEDVEPDFNVVLVTKKATWGGEIRKRLAQAIPRPRKIAYGLAGLAVAIFILLAIANTEISYRQGEFRLTMGLFSKPPEKTLANDRSIQQLVEKLQQENYYLTSSLIQQSEARQRKELASNLLKLKQDFERQRVEDLNLVGFGLDNIEKKTYRQIQQTDRSLHEIIQLINAQPK